MSNSLVKDIVRPTQIKPNPFSTIGKSCNTIIIYWTRKEMQILIPLIFIQIFFNFLFKMTLVFEYVKMAMSCEHFTHFDYMCFWWLPIIVWVVSLVERNLSTRWVWPICRSCLAVVTLGLPLRGLSLVTPMTIKLSCFRCWYNFPLVQIFFECVIK